MYHGTTRLDRQLFLGFLWLCLISFTSTVKVDICSFLHISRTRRNAVISAGYLTRCGPGSSVGIATDYGLDSPGSNPGREEIFRPSRPALGPTQPPVKWEPGLSQGKVRPGRAADNSPPSSAAVMEEYLYPHSGPHRACNGNTLPLPLFISVIG